MIFRFVESLLYLVVDSIPKRLELINVSCCPQCFTILTIASFRVPLMHHFAWYQGQLSHLLFDLLSIPLGPTTNMQGEYGT